MPTEKMKMPPLQNRLRGSLPKIGIRPTIDGRLGGVRESLENQTMGMAKTAVRIIAENVKHPNGMDVECVIADTCIGGVAEAAAAEEKFKREGVGVSLTVTPCWCYGSETMDMDPLTPKAVWGFNGTERPGAVYLAAVLAGHNQKGLPTFGIYGRDVQDSADTSVPEAVKEKLLRFARAGLAVAAMKGKSYLSMGSVSMGIAGSIVNEDFFQNYLGMRNEYVDMSEFIRRIDEKIYDPDEFRLALKWVKLNCKEGPDNNAPDMQRSREQKNRDWCFIVKMAMIARDLMVGQPYIVATENDSLNAVVMLFGHLLTGTAQIFSDVRTYWSPEAIKRVTGIQPKGKAEGGIIHLINSGPTALDGTGEQSLDGKAVIKPWWEVTSDEARKCLEVTLWRPANTGYFKGGGYSSDFLTRGDMPVTMSRINLVKGLGSVLQIAEGFTVDLPERMHDMLDLRTDPTWPTTWFVPRLTGKGPFKDVYSLMANWGANHGAISYGHIGADLITLASMLRIPVCMQNVAEEQIYRPSAWSAFGMDSEGADYRACTTFGSLYR
jgi:L-fucose isomerase